MDFCILSTGKLLHIILYSMQKAAIQNILKKKYLMVHFKGLGEFVIKKVTLIKKLKTCSVILVGGYDKTFAQMQKVKLRSKKTDISTKKDTHAGIKESVFLCKN